jgi:hypothetical protein
MSDLPRTQNPEDLKAAATMELKTTTSATHKPDSIAVAFRRHEMPASLSAMTAEGRRRKEKHLVRKLDLRLMVPLIVMYIMNYLDRSVPRDQRVVSSAC